MKPNGRRAWRRFAKQQRRKVNRRNRQTGTPWINDADGAFYRHEQKHFEQRPIVPVGPFTAHSLVGMTMGERKRKAWTAYQSGLSESWSFWCAKYGIGESLRPCLGCSWCGTDPGDRKDGRWTECDGSGVLPAKSTKAKRPA